MDTQMSACAQEEVKIKRQFLDRLDSMDRYCNGNLKALSSNIKKLTNCIADIFSLFRASMSQQPFIPPIPYGYYSQPMGSQPLPQNEFNCLSVNSISSAASIYSQFIYLDGNHNQF